MAGVHLVMVGGLGAVVANTLAALTLSNSSIAENSAANTVVGAIQGLTTGSTLSIASQSNANWFAISGTNLIIGSSSPDFETKANPTVTIRETLAGATNSPRDTTLTVTITNVFEAATLSALALDSNTATSGTAKTINITGASAGSTITVQSGSLPAGLTLNSAARTISGTPSAAGTSNFTLRQTLADSSNSPRDTALSITVAAAVLYSASGGFENTLDSYTSNGNHVFASPGRSGSFSLQRTNSGYLSVTRTFTALPAGTLNFSMWHRAISGSPQRGILVEVNGAAGTWAALVTNSSTTWTEATHTQTIPANSSVVITIVSDGSAAVPAFDDWSLQVTG